MQVPDKELPFWLFVWGGLAVILFAPALLSWLGN